MAPLTRGLLVVGALLLVWLALELMLLLFAGILLAIFLRTLAAGLTRYTGLPVGVSLAVVCLTLVGVLVLGGWLYAPRLAEQGDQLAETLPKVAGDMLSWLREYSWGAWVLDQFSEQVEDADMAGQATSAARGVINAVIAVVIVLFVGLYLAAQPAPYIQGLLYLVPLPRRVRVAETLFAIGHVLRWWMVGQVLAMTLVGLTMGIGLAVIGVPFSFLLGVLAGLFEFIPLVGPALALGPALLLAIAAGPQEAVSVLILYLIVQMLEGYVLTPLVQQRTVELPPVVTITAQVALSWMAGPIGLIVAVPLTAAAMVATQMLYVEDALGDDRAAPEFESEAQREVAEERAHMLREVVPTSGTPGQASRDRA